MNNKPLAILAVIAITMQWVYYGIGIANIFGAFVVLIFVMGVIKEERQRHIRRKMFGKHRKAFAND